VAFYALCLFGYFVLTKYVVYVLGGISHVIAVNRYHTIQYMHECG